MIALFTDFGLCGPYTGQVKAVLARRAPGVPVIDLFADAPAFDPRLAAYLLAAYAEAFEPVDVILAVVDPGVGSARRPLVLEADRLWLTGPDNGLFELILRRARTWRCWPITWEPTRLSATFHGRDLFAPAAARLALGERPEADPIEPARFADWPDDLPAIVYVDHYGNAMTGLRAGAIAEGTVLEVAGERIAQARTFADVAPGRPLWYENSNGLVEIAVNGGRAAEHFGLRPGSPITIGAAGWTFPDLTEACVRAGCTVNLVYGFDRAPPPNAAPSTTTRLTAVPERVRPPPGHHPGRPLSGSRGQSPCRFPPVPRSRPLKFPLHRPCASRERDDASNR